VNSIKDAILQTIQGYDKLIISPDMDGFLSAQLLSSAYGSKVVGTYDKNILVLSKDVNIEECLFVDCDINRNNLHSIGNHMRLLNDNMSSKSFNPNVHYGVTTYSDKFPFATAFLIAFALETPISPNTLIRMAYADSTLKNMESYSDNMRNWSERIPCDAVHYIIEHSDDAKQADLDFREIYPNQSFSSKRYGKARYIETLNNSLMAEGIPYDTLIEGKKYMTDKVGKNTVIRYNRDILSYAEVYGGEYSITYDQEIEWK